MSNEPLLFNIAKVPFLFVIVPSAVTVNVLLPVSLVNVAFPVLVKLPPIVIPPALFVTVAVPLFVAIPLIIIPSAPVFNIVKPLVLILPVEVTFIPPFAWLVIVASPFVLPTVPEISIAFIAAFLAVISASFSGFLIPFKIFIVPALLTLPEISIPCEPVL